MQKQVAEVETSIAAPPARVWKAITGDGATMMPGTTVETDWTVGHPITFSGEWQGKRFEDHGEIRSLFEDRELSFTHWSGGKTRPEEYHLVTYRLAADGQGTRVTLTQSNVGTTVDIDEKTRAEFTRNWARMLEHLKNSVEGTASASRH